VLGAHLPAEIQPIVRFAFITGWRISEVLKLEGAAWTSPAVGRFVWRGARRRTRNRVGSR